jgi:WD40 repeat protein
MFSNKFQSLPPFFKAITFSPDSRDLVFISTRGVDLLDVNTGRSRPAVVGNGSTFSSVSFSGDGKLGVVSGPGLAPGPREATVVVLDIKGNKRLLEFKVEEAYLLRFSPDAKAFALQTGRGLLELRETVSGKLLRTMAGPKSGYIDLSFAPNGRTLATVGEEESIRLWDVLTGTERTVGDGHKGRVYALGFSPDEKYLASGGLDGAIRLWNTDSWTDTSLTTARFGIRSMAFLPDGKLLSGDDGGMIKLWDVPTKRLMSAFRADQRGIRAVLYQPDRALLSLGREGGIRRFHLGSERVLSEIRQPFLNVRRATGPDEVLVHIFPPSTLKSEIWCLNLGNQKARFKITDLPSQCDRMEASEDGRYLAVGGIGEVAVWELLTGTRVIRIATPGSTFPRFALFGNEPIVAPGASRASALGFLPQNRLIFGMVDGSVHIASLASGQVEGGKPTQSGEVVCFAISPGKKLLASAHTNTTINVWRIPDPTKERFRHDIGKFKAHWKRLGHQDATIAHKAICYFAHADESKTISWFREQIAPEPRLAPGTILRLVRDVDDPTFAVRQRAETELTKLNDCFVLEEELQKAIAKVGSTVELRKRIERLLEKPKKVEPSFLRALRAIEVLETLGTGEAQELLHRLGKGEPTAKLSREADAALRRLSAPRWRSTSTDR